MSISKLALRPIATAEDAKLLDAHRAAYWEADLEVLHGYRRSPGVETAICEKDGGFVAAMVATQVVLFDFIQNAATWNTDRFAAALLLERALAFAAQKAGCVDAYIAVPSQLSEYIEQLKRCGYDLAATNCVIMRRPLVPDICPSLGDARDAVGETSPKTSVGGFPPNSASGPPHTENMLDRMGD